MKKTLLALAALGLFTAACQKSETGLSATEKMVVGKWRLTYAKSFTVFNGTVSTSIDMLAAMDSCMRDDLTDLRSDHTYNMDQGNNLCFPMFPKEVRWGTWKLADNDQKLLFTLDSPSQVTTNRILELTSTRMKLYVDTTYLQDDQTISTKLIQIYEK